MHPDKSIILGLNVEYLCVFVVLYVVFSVSDTFRVRYSCGFIMNYGQVHAKDTISPWREIQPYTNLLTSGKLPEHLHEIDVAAFERHELIVRQMMKSQNVTEQLKADDMMKWVGMVNNIRNCVDEIIRNELIYI